MEWDPRFQRMPARQGKVKIGGRFRHMFKDKDFRSASSKHAVNKYGRKMRKEHESAEQLKRFYDVDSDDDDDSDDDSDEDEQERQQPLKKKKKKKESESSSSSSSSEPEQSSSSDSSDDDSSSDDDDDDEPEPTSVVPEAPVIDVEDATRRFAVLKCDWENVRAVDLYMILHSFLTPGGVIESVRVYPSEFGKKMLAEEERMGPQGVWKGETQVISKPMEESSSSSSSSESSPRRRRQGRRSTPPPPSSWTPS
eukprot:TRINITY_DN66461_c5_g4_i4.p1 TRINITY_DN66461_c5_g4~~TRINITY_DN66461_c5_g4_i4.p1  ORF type:complete len:253 (-),score=133.23 TRINITY_DN66461_c5_g4_i4:989-1747(-)